MIVETMTSREIYENLEKDSTKVKIRLDYYRNKAIKQLKTKHIFPALVSYDYTVPDTRNKYALLYYAETRHHVSCPITDSVFEIYINRVRYFYKQYISLYTPENGDPYRIRHIQIFTKHFMDRYKERIWSYQKHSFDDAAFAFFVRNQQYAPIHISKNINFKIDEYGDAAQYGYRVRDGFCFTRSVIEVEGNDVSHIALTIFTSFVNESSMHISQRDAIDIKHLELEHKLIKAFKQYEQNGEWTLVLKK